MRCLTYKKTNHRFEVVASHINTVEPGSVLASLVNIFWPDFIQAVRNLRYPGPFTNSEQEQVALDKYIGKTLLYAFMRRRETVECFDDPVAVKQTILSTTIEIVSQENPGEWRQVRNIRRHFSMECTRTLQALWTAPHDIKEFAQPIAEDPMQTWIDGIKTMTDTIRDTWEIVPSAKAIISFVILMAATDKAEQMGKYRRTQLSRDFIGGLGRWLQPIRGTRKELLVSGFFDLLYPDWRLYVDAGNEGNLHISDALRDLLLTPASNEMDDYSIPHLLMSTLVDGDWNEELKPPLTLVTAGALLNTQYRSIATPDPDDYEYIDPNVTSFFNLDEFCDPFQNASSQQINTGNDVEIPEIRLIQNDLICGSLFGKALRYLHGLRMAAQIPTPSTHG